jgi:hypothetical protein
MAGSAPANHFERKIGICAHLKTNNAALQLSGKRIA